MLGYIIPAILVLPVLLLLAANMLKYVLFNSAARKFNKLPIPEDVRARAVECFARARHSERKTWWADCTAPICVPIVLLFTKRSANKLPGWAQPWENNVSINGDSGGTLMDDGTWLDWRDTPLEMWKELYGKPQLSYSDEGYTGDAYYCKGHHPRSFLARYVWLGLRNRASAYAVKVGEDVLEPPCKIAEGDGWWVMQAGELYQWMSEEKTWKVCIRRNLGYKLNNAGVGKRAAATAISWSIRRA